MTIFTVSHTHMNHLPHQAHDVFGVVGAVGVAADAAVLVFCDLILIDHPFQRAAVAEAIFEDFGRDAA